MVCFGGEEEDQEGRNAFDQPCLEPVVPNLYGRGLTLFTPQCGKVTLPMLRGTALIYYLLLLPIFQSKAAAAQTGSGADPWRRLSPYYDEPEVKTHQMWLRVPVGAGLGARRQR